MFLPYGHSGDQVEEVLLEILQDSKQIALIAFVNVIMGCEQTADLPLTSRPFSLAESMVHPVGQQLLVSYSNFLSDLELK